MTCKTCGGTGMIDASTARAMCPDCHKPFADAAPGTVGLNVVRLPPSNLNDIAALIEAVARKVRDGELEPASGACVLIDDAGELAVFGWGRTDDVHTAGLLTMGAAWLAQHKVAR